MRAVRHTARVVGFPKRRPLRIAAFVGLVGLLVIATTGLLGVLFPTRALASSSTLAILDGTVQVSTDGTRFADGKDGSAVPER